jgi:hypothetical protein
MESPSLLPKIRNQKLEIRINASSSRLSQQARRPKGLSSTF